MALLALAKNARLIGFDVDELMMKKAEMRIREADIDAAGRIEYIHGNYSDIKNVLK